MCWRTLTMLSAMPCGIFCGAKICGMQSRRWMCRPIPKRLPRRRHRAPTNQLGHRSVEDQRRDSERRLEMQFIRMTMVVAFVVAALPGFAKDKEAQFKSVEAKHFERAEGVELSPEFTDYLYAELRRGGRTRCWRRKPHTKLSTSLRKHSKTRTQRNRQGSLGF